MLKTFATAAVLLAAATPVLAQQAQDVGEAQTPETVVGEQPQPQRLGAIAADDLEDRDIYDLQGRELGEIETIVLDPAHGRIAYVIVELGGVLGIGEREVAVPWSSLQITADGKRLQLDISRDRLSNAPQIDRDEVARVNDPDIARSIHAYFGSQPYWQESTQQAETPDRPLDIGD